MTAAPPCASADAEVLLNEYVDGELEAARQPALFAHLAACADCRAQFDALFAFRLAVRQEPLPVPPAVDAAVFARLDRSRRAGRRAPDRRAERSPVGTALRRRVSVGLALAVAAVAVVVGNALAPGPTPAPPEDRVVETFLDDGPLYLLDPGVRVEAPRAGGVDLGAGG
ncbi:zf-HC2 domain-containing protein [Rubrivirga sp. S365]|uniref:Zf-HC2 domain-containing protein n=1 Tax=Rubrivirga litoralis TaxID=3075598 RepID=A0ABU3BVE6_9BACT|nr:MULTISPECIES: zf-HC2 domain-containing protein [unclassified Rubrivirga]MDT0633270.1 zf-HC2 domain-containing protein [Rubrivirga sp. F394]MDT7857009.1 zf-HC2 domain-containing protein [Rubrivirga sp. S365]